MRTVKELTELLVELGNLEDSFFKSRAYKNAALSIQKDLTNEDLMKLEDFTYLEGVGESINDKILEYRTTGSIGKLIILRQENKGFLDPKFYKVRKSFVTKRIPSIDALCILNDLGIHMFDYRIAGSLRRGKELVGDIDILIPSDQYEDLLKVLSAKYDVISSGDYKSSFLVDRTNNIQLDVIRVSTNELPFQLLYLTGSAQFNIRMRAHAKELGYTLNQVSIFNSSDGSDVNARFTTEEDIFRFLGMDYVKPEDR